MNARKNPHYPHKCRIYHREGATSFNPEGNVVELYSGVCRKEGSNNIRAFEVGSNSTGKTDVNTYRVSIPGIIKGLQKGDFVDIMSRITTEKGVRIVSFSDTEIGQSGTDVICIIPSN